MDTVNVLVMIHGMTLDEEPRSHTAEYEELWAALTAREPVLAQAFAPPVMIEYGHEPPDTALEDLRGDQLLMRAENTLNEVSSYAEVRRDPSPYNHLLSVGDELSAWHFTEVLSKWLLRPFVLTPFKERVMVRGFTDALYYCSPEGEVAIRDAVYGQFLRALEPYKNATQIRLHVVGHSLGVTVAFDFLFGLFAPYHGDKPGFVKEGSDPEAVTAFCEWRARAQDGRLVLASKASAGGQLPLMMMRKQALVTRLALGDHLDASVIGILPNAPLTWKLFYDADDALGFPARRLFEPQAAIQEFEVNTHWRPDLSHVRYWHNDDVQRGIASLLAQRR